MCLPAIPIYPLLLAPLLVPATILYAIFSSKYQKKRSRKNLTIVIILLTICMGGMALILYSFWDYYYQANYEMLDYSLELKSVSGNEEVIYLPVSQNENLQRAIRITAGVGRMDIIETVYGTALQINFTGSINIVGKLNVLRDLNNYSLTLVNQSQYNETMHGFNVEYWIYFQPFNPLDYNCSFKMCLYHETYNTWHWERCEGYLSPEWKTYWGINHGFGALC